MPKGKMWTEWLFSKLPFYDSGVKYQIPIRFLFVLAIWLIGLVFSIVGGQFDYYVHWYQIYPILFGSMMIVLVGSYLLSVSLGRTLDSFEPLLDMDREGFERFKAKTARFSYSTLPILAIAVALFLYLPSGLDFSMLPQTVWKAWTFVMIFTFDFVSATGVWMGAALWITIFFISRQPFKTEISSNTVEKFRGLTSLTLLFALFYFIAITITMVIPLLATVTSINMLYDLLFSPLILFIVVGVAGTLLPFYNIHNTLISIKRRLLRSISKEFEEWQRELDTALQTSGSNTAQHTMLIMSNLIRLEMKERRTLLAPEWPFDVSFVSKLLAVILIPAIVRIFVDIYSRTFILPP